MNLKLLINRLERAYFLLRSPIAINAFLRHKVLAGNEHRHVLPSSLKTIIDIGANRGQFTLAARIWSPQAKVIAFEPLSQAVNLFTKIFSKDPQVTLHQMAIGSEFKSMEMHISAKDDSSSLLSLSDLQTTMFPFTAEVGKESVAVRPLSLVVSQEDIQRPALLKLDVQGYEYEALLGSLELLPNIDLIYSECSFLEFYTGQKLAHHVVSLLEKNGFILTGFYNPSYDEHGQCLQADLLFHKLNR
jgi:FkbM family methyltransferase